MSDFKKRKLKKVAKVSSIKKTTKKRRYKKRWNGNIIIKKFILFSLLLFLIAGFIWFLYIYNNYIKNLPKITKLEEIVIPEASIIYDRDGNELYTLYSWEKRTYVEYDDISENMRNAIISIEDKTFFENKWIDFKGLVRAFFYYATKKTNKIQGTSTISQQLIKNVFLSNERKVERKIKEMYLSYKLNKTYTKEKILELYLNKISFWSNAYGIEQAAKTFFEKSSKDLNILESSILASLPKWPTYYSPYNHHDRLVGYLYTYKVWEDNKQEETKKLISKEELEKEKWLKDEFISIINNLKWKRLTESKILLCWINKDKYKSFINVDGDNCSIMEYSELNWFLNNIQIIREKDWSETILEYQTWRKDLVIWRMLEDNKINFEEYKDSIIKSIWFEFSPYTENIKHPHFVFYVKEYLEKKYGKELIEQEWLKIYTSIDSKAQEKAEDIIKKQIEVNKKKFEANNAALISIDNKTGQIISMVWWADFFDKENAWNVNIITSKRQAGSTFKPFVYALAMTKNQIWTKTPIYDLKTEFPWDYSPGNYDWKFLWLMNITTALNYSRNIPAIKMYFKAWEQWAIINFVEKLWINSLNKKFYYWAPLALWTWELEAIELAKAYSVFANMWYKKEISPILKILDTNWNIIEENINKAGAKVISENTAYLINKILSDKDNRPNPFWNNYLTLNNRVVAAKTGTSNKKEKGKILPWDLWTAGYTPNITTVVWAWNNDWSAMNAKWNWLEWAWVIWKEFMEFVHKDIEKKESWETPKNIKSASISKISWKLAPPGYEEKLKTTSFFIKDNLPTEFDDSYKAVKVDILCNWKPGKNTPEAAIAEKYYIDFRSIDPNKEKWEESIKKWIEEWWHKKLLWNIKNVITNYKDKQCTRSQVQINNSNIKIKAIFENNDDFINWYNYLKIWYRSSNSLLYIDVLLNWNKIDQIKLENKKEWVISPLIKIPNWYYGKYKLSLRAVDSIYYSNSHETEINIVKKDIKAPRIKITNPIDEDIVINKWSFFNLRWELDDRTKIRSINIYINNKPIKLWLTWRDFVFPINKDWKLDIWKYEIKVEAYDFYKNISHKIVNLEVIE